MNDRGMIKWEPFNAVIPSQKMINDVMHEKKKIKKPVLSEEQKLVNEVEIVASFNEGIEITISYYEAGFIEKTKGIIKKIDSVNKKIYFQNHSIYFSQILEVD